ncbi:hypothetical protein QMK19_19620 [Streptomyces sp. H10-C2]|uniref:hypothetical protein n=1 Tax=unclassified Streptomyces TaxID=2593676 RepID=UPI0024BAFFA4|nr:MULTISPECIES: hypothetical protein [unclassified Streptomyces]MDJ0343365.1 hypothetical protein [Streptomyces sp. PH10-H1]MDJ0371824.1 hypothetical protein [Streptomyces sp. H10-C2]
MPSLFSETVLPESSLIPAPGRPSTDPFLSPALLPFAAAETDDEFDADREGAPQ